MRITMLRNAVVFAVLAVSIALGHSAQASLPDVSLVLDQNVTLSGGQYARITLPQSGMNGGYTYTLTVRQVSGQQALYGDPYIYGLVWKTGSTTKRVRRQSRFPGDIVEQTSMDGSLQDQGEDNAEFRIYCETSVSSCYVKATVHLRAPGGNDVRVFYTEGSEPGVSNYQVSTLTDFYHPTEHTGDHGLQVLYEANDYIYLFRNNGVSPGTSNALSFWIRSSGSIDENDLWVVLTDSTNTTLFPWQTLSNYVAIKQSHTWYKVVVPLSDLGVSGGSFNGVALMSTQSGFAYFDEIQLESANLANLKMPLPAGDDWYLTVEVGGASDCTNPGGDPFHYPNAAYYSIDFAPRTLSNGNGSTPLADVPILAAGSGKVIEAPSTEDPFNGYYVRIDHDFPYDGSGLTSYYLHLRSSAASLLGDIVPQGKQLGYMGTTGESSAVHLHFQLKFDGVSTSSAQGLAGTKIDGRAIEDYEVGCRTNVPPSGFYPSSNVSVP